MEKIALYGGAFDPVHRGHIDVSQGILKTGIIDQVWLMPCNQHVFEKDLTSAKHRLKMCNIACEGVRGVSTFSYEINKGLSGKTYDFLKSLLSSDYVDRYQFYYIIGLDNALNIQEWYNWEEVINMIPFIVVPRKGYQDVTRDLKWFHHKPHIYLREVDAIDCSSTEVREFCSSPKLEQYVDFLDKIDLRVLTYIHDNKLYKDKGFFSENSLSVKELENKEETLSSEIKIKETETVFSSDFLETKRTEFTDKKGRSREWFWVKRTKGSKAVMIIATVGEKLVITREHRIPLNFEDGDPYEWSFPAGLVEEGENVQDAVVRELKEETGLTVKEITKISPFTYNSAGLTDESVANVWVDAEGEVSNKHNESSEDIITVLADKEYVKNLLEDPNKKIGAKAWLVMDEFISDYEVWKILKEI